MAVLVPPRLPKVPTFRAPLRPRLPHSPIGTLRNGTTVHFAGKPRELDARTTKLFGRPLAAEEIADVSSAPPRSHIRLELSELKRGSLRVTVEHPMVRTMRRIFHRDEQGKLVVSHDFLSMSGVAPQGTGTKLLRRAVDAYRRYGVDRIETKAARFPRLVGYVVWPRLGFDGQLPPHVHRLLPPHLAKAKTLQALYALDGGMAWWREHGADVDVSFSLRSGSPHLRQFIRYLQSKGAKDLPPLELAPVRRYAPEPFHPGVNRRTIERVSPEPLPWRSHRP